jgi:hypothetical protein
MDQELCTFLGAAEENRRTRQGNAKVFDWLPAPEEAR